MTPDLSYYWGGVRESSARINGMKKKKMTGRARTRENAVATDAGTSELSAANNRVEGTLFFSRHCPEKNALIRDPIDV